MEINENSVFSALLSSRGGWCNVPVPGKPNDKLNDVINSRTILGHLIKYSRRWNSNKKGLLTADNSFL